MGTDMMVTVDIDIMSLEGASVRGGGTVVRVDRAAVLETLVASAFVHGTYHLPSSTAKILHGGMWRRKLGQVGHSRTPEMTRPASPVSVAEGGGLCKGRRVCARGDKAGVRRVRALCFSH